MSSVFATTTAGTLGFTVTPTSGIITAVWMIGNSPTSGLINVSIDNGATWNSYNVGLSPIRGIAYGLTDSNNPLWVAAGGSGIATSVSGNSWNIVSGVTVSSVMNCVAYGKNGSGQNLFMIGGYSTTGSNTFSSSNGTTWTGVADYNILNYVSGITYGKFSNGTGVWVAVGIATSGGAGVAISTDGTSWTRVSTTSLIPISNRFTSISFGIDNAGNKRWVACAEMNNNTSSCIYTLINPVDSASFASWTAIPSQFMSGRAYSVAFGRSVSGNTFVIAGAVGAGTGSTIVTYDGTTATGYIPATNGTPYQGCQVGYLNTGNIENSRFYLTHLQSAVPSTTIANSQYGNSWSNIGFTYTITSPNDINGAVATSMPY